MPAQFVLPAVEENAEGWGPTSVPEQFDGVPFMPYSKGERLGRIADFGQQAGRGMFAGALRHRARWRALLLLPCLVERFPAGDSVAQGLLLPRSASRLDSAVLPLA